MPRTPKPSGRKLPDKGEQLSQKRVVKTRSTRPVFLIVCEGKQTESNYFKAFELHLHLSITVEVVGLGDNTLNLVRQAGKRAKQGAYSQVWCVFDRDSFPAGQFNEALVLAEREGFKVAYSNEAFELWYLLHFYYHDTGIARVLYEDKLTERLGKPYRKNDPAMYRLLEDLQPAAIRNAQTLLDSYGEVHNPEQDNPCTTVHLLVQELNRHAP